MQLTVHHDAAVGDPFFGITAGTQPGRRHPLGEAFRAGFTMIKQRFEVVAERSCP